MGCEYNGVHTEYFCAEFPKHAAAGKRVPLSYPAADRQPIYAHERHARNGTPRRHSPLRHWSFVNVVTQSKQ